MDKLKTKILLISLLLILLLSFQGVAAASDDSSLTSENIDLSICDNEGNVDSDSILTAANGEDPLSEGKDNSTITITDYTSPISIGDDTSVGFKINRDVMDNAVILRINGSEILTYDFDTNEDSFLITKDKFPSEGTYNITVQYLGNSRYNASNIASCMIAVNKINVTMNAKGSTIHYGENATITVTGLPDDATGSVSVRVGDGIFFANITNGKAVIEIPDLIVHEYEGLIVKYSGDNKYNEASAEATVIVKASSEDISGKAGEKTDTLIKITDENGTATGNPIAILAMALLTLLITYRKKK